MGVIFENFHYAVVIVLMMTGLYTVFSSGNLIKKLVGLSVFQTSVFLLYITIAKVAGGQPPILPANDHNGDHAGDHAGNLGSDVADQVAGNLVVSAEEVAIGEGGQYGSEIIFSNPLPHVLILTAIVVGVATLAIGLALVVRIREVYGTIEEDDINRQDYQYNLEGTEV